MAEAVCIQCGGEKDLPLGRCGACGFLPAGEDRAVSLLASTRVLDAAGLAEVQARIRRGERLSPGREARARAWALLREGGEPPITLGRGQLLALALVNVFLTSMLGWAAWWRWRERPGAAARQALAVTAPVSLGIFVLWVALAVR